MAELLEDGDIYFLYRPRVQEEHVDSLEEVQRLLVVLHPWQGRHLRLLVVGRKRLPDIDEHDRFWAFVDEVVNRPEQLHKTLQARRYRTKTRDERTQPPARPAEPAGTLSARGRSPPVPKVKLPAALQEKFHGRRFAPLDPPGFLDHPGTELVLIGAAHDASEELQVDLDAEVERAERSTIFEDLRIGREERPVAPLFAGEWA